MQPISCQILLLSIFSTLANDYYEYEYDDYEPSGDGDDDECWGNGVCHPDKRNEDSIDCITCPQVTNHAEMSECVCSSC